MKVILIDNGVFMFRAIMAWRNMKDISMGYIYTNMIIANLKRINMSKGDRVIIAQDGGRSWRKDYNSEYKANRKDFREKYEDEIDWTLAFKTIEDTVNSLCYSAGWDTVKISKIEADDIIAVACKIFKDDEVVVVSTDADLQQLCAHKNVKVFSPMVKIKNGKGGYKIIKQPYKIIMDKVKKGDVSDNIIVRDTDTKEDVENREFIINLLQLPDFIENPVIEAINNLQPKGQNLDSFPFPSIGKRFHQVYDKKFTVTYEDSEKEEEKRKAKKKVKSKNKGAIK